MAAYNPLRRVPTLVLDDATALVDSNAILDHLDEQVGPARALFPAAGPARRAALRIAALAAGLAEKAVSLVYERVLHTEPSALWSERCRTQIAEVVRLLEAERAARATPYWQGEAIGHADIMLACALRFAREAHPGLIDDATIPALMAHCARCEALPAFVTVRQVFVPPA
ncbi:glutathione S-transferase family protein [Sphingomonas sp. RT2P30]|uniref:glutathione S-transferase family protein n=1 Tax=Parasphingomonas halimpatiens TaxID=3096162 RepID=UPI002FC6A199